MSQNPPLPHRPTPTPASSTPVAPAVEAPLPLRLIHAAWMLAVRVITGPLVPACHELAVTILEGNLDAILAGVSSLRARTGRRFSVPSWQWPTELAMVGELTLGDLDSALWGVEAAVKMVQADAATQRAQSGPVDELFELVRREVVRSLNELGLRSAFELARRASVGDEVWVAVAYDADHCTVGSIAHCQSITCAATLLARGDVRGAALGLASRNGETIDAWAARAAEVAS